MQYTDAVYFRDNQFSLTHHYYDNCDKYEFADKLVNDSTCILHSPVTPSYNSGVPIEKQRHKMVIDGKVVQLCATVDNPLDDFCIRLGDEPSRTYITGIIVYANNWGEWRISHMNGSTFIDFLNLSINRGLKYACEKHIEVLQMQIHDLAYLDTWLSKHIAEDSNLSTELQRKIINTTSKTTILSEEIAKIQQWINQNYY